MVEWINESRIDLFSPYLDFDDPEEVKNIQAMGELIQAAVPKLEQLLASVKQPEAAMA